MPTFVGSCTNINASYVSGNTTMLSTLDTLDLCTVEGITNANGGNAVPGVVVDNSNLPNNTCRMGPVSLNDK